MTDKKPKKPEPKARKDVAIIPPPPVAADRALVIETSEPEMPVSLLVAQCACCGNPKSGGVACAVCGN